MKKVLKTTLAVLLVAALIAAFAVGLAACNDKDGQGSDFDSVFYDASAASEKGGGSGTLELYVPDGAPALAVAKFIAEKDTLTVAGYKIEVNIVPANQIGAHMAKGDGDIVIMPANAGVNLIMKGAEYKFVCSNTRGILYMISRTEGAVKPADLAGKKVGCIGQGAVPEYALMTVLEANGLADSVEVQFFADGAGVQSALTAGTIDFGIVGEPAATAGASKGFFTVMDIQAEFNAATDSKSGFPMSSTFVTNELASDKTFMDALFAVLEENVEFISDAENAKNMTVLMQGAGSTSAYPPASIPRCNVGVYTGDDVKAAVKDMTEFFAQA